MNLQREPKTLAPGYGIAIYRYLISTAEGPFAVTKTCRICGFSDTRKRGVGRGSGFRLGNQSMGRVIQHIKREHPDLWEK